MKTQKILILLLQETHVNQNVREIRKNYIWFLAGDAENGEENHTEAGVAIVIHNSLVPTTSGTTFQKRVQATGAGHSHRSN